MHFSNDNDMNSCNDIDLVMIMISMSSLCTSASPSGPCLYARRP